ncbi:MAG: hypothetical protein HY896_09205 [Deltaproteobacteria bacterium]|nr:hypothetical protein [Deltaproteobacteria bacterium]
MRSFIVVCLLMLAVGSAGAELGTAVVETRPYSQNNASLEVSMWDVGGGNFFRPNANIILNIHGARASRVTLSSLDSNGVLTEIQALSCRDGERVNFNTKYNIGGTRALVIRLFDARNNMLAELTRNVP